MNGFLAATTIVFALLSTTCGRAPVTEQNTSDPPAAAPSSFTASTTPSPSPARPNLQTELLDDRFKNSTSPLANVDFKNFTYPLPRGWQNPDGSDLTLANGKLDPVSADTDLGMDPGEAAAAKSQRRIGASYVTTRFFDVTGDDVDEAFVILKIETTGSAVPQIVYIYSYQGDKPELIWYFRTGDRADGGLKDMRPENGQFVLELYGQDRFLLGETETAKITDDYEQICCPTFFTRSVYKWNGRSFQMQGKRLTFSVTDANARPVENMAEVVEKQNKSAKR